jgi:hypothetical protein
MPTEDKRDEKANSDQVVKGAQPKSRTPAFPLTGFRLLVSFLAVLTALRLLALLTTLLA